MHLHTLIRTTALIRTVGSRLNMKNIFRWVGWSTLHFAFHVHWGSTLCLLNCSFSPADHQIDYKTKVFYSPCFNSSNTEIKYLFKASCNLPVLVLFDQDHTLLVTRQPQKGVNHKTKRDPCFLRCLSSRCDKFDSTDRNVICSVHCLNISEADWKKVKRRKRIYESSLARAHGPG